MAERTGGKREELAALPRHLLADHPHGRSNPEAGDVTEAASNTHAVFSIPELGIALDTPRIIFLLCIIALLLTFADYTAKVKRARRARRR